MTPCTIPHPHRFLTIFVVCILSCVIYADAYSLNFNSETGTAYETIDEIDGSNDLALRFGGILQEFLTFSRAFDRFEFSNDLYVRGDLATTGTLSGASLTVPNIVGSTDAASGSILVSRSVGQAEWKSPVTSLVWYIEGDLSSGTRQGAVVTMPFGMTVTGIDLHVKGAPTGQALIIDVNEAGATLYSTKPQINDGGSTEAGTEVLSDASLARGAEITIDIDQVGSTFAGSGLTIMVHGTRTY